MKKHLFLLPAVCLLLTLSAACCNSAKEADSPRIVNIINFIRYTEPRIDAITEEVLYNTVVTQAEDLRSKDLVGTWLLEYDALIDTSYQALMKEELARGCEVGAWFEITQPQVEDAGLVWRGRYAWDWFAHVAFSVGYTPEERVKLVDVYMEKFKEIFGDYPKSVGAWIIDARTLAYMYEKYGIESSCICRDQVGTDGYTLWGGYWNGGYYPSKQNIYMPAQTEEGGIGVPVFRMLGSDPIYQYEAGLGGAKQYTVTLEPVYPKAGGNPQWIDWYFKMFTEEPHMGFNYVQAGQENSFTWRKMGAGFVYQTEQLAALRKEGKVRIETLRETGRWFKKQYPVTPPTSLIATEDYRDEQHKTLWFNCRNYRANLLWTADTLKFRDIHLFDEHLRSAYIDAPEPTPIFRYETLPLVDGCLWSSAEKLAGLYFVAPDFKGGDPVFTVKDGGKCQEVVWPSASGDARFILSLTEDGINISSEGNMGDWFLELDVNPGARLPFGSMNAKECRLHYLDVDYAWTLRDGVFEDLRAEGDAKVFRILPEEGKISF